MKSMEVSRETNRNPLYQYNGTSENTKEAKIVK